MINIKELEIASITKDKRTQPRANIDEAIVNEYRLDMLNGDEFPPVMIFQENGNNYLADGWHRVAAAEALQNKTIQCAIKPGTVRDAILYSCSVNADHGKRRTNGDKERAVKKLLQDEEWVQWSDHTIARLCRVSHPFVSSLRRTISQPLTGNITSEKKERKYETKHGTTAVMDTSNIGKAKQDKEEPEPQPDFFTAPLPQPEASPVLPKYDPLNYRLFISPITEISQHIERDSIDAIITDPPYPKEYIHTFEELAQQAAIVLKPGGVLVALAGHPYIDTLIERMKKHLTFHWLGCYYMPTGPHASLPYYSVSIYWKPLIIMSKGVWPKNKTFQDTVINDDADKRYHEWGQGISGFARLVEMFTLPNQSVLDPFMGGGTTAIATLKSNRYFYGSDISAEEVEKTRARLT